METDASSNFCSHFGVAEHLHISMKAWELLPLSSCGKVLMYQVSSKYTFCDNPQISASFIKVYFLLT